MEYKLSYVISTIDCVTSIFKSSGQFSTEKYQLP